MNRKNQNLRKLTFQALLIAISIILVAVVEVSIMPGAPYLKYDPSDIPLLFISFVFGGPTGAISAIIVAFIQSFMLHGSSGAIGFIMNAVATSLMCFVVGIMTKKNKSSKNLIFSLVIGVLVMTVTMSIINVFVIPIFLEGKTFNLAKVIAFSVIPFNLIKGTINSVAAYYVYKLLEKRGIIKKIIVNS